MNITYKSTVDQAESWRLIANGETFIPIAGEVEFQKDVQNLLKVVYKISGIDGTEVTINYECTETADEDNSFEDPNKKSPVKKTVPQSNEAQVTLNIPIQ